MPSVRPANAVFCVTRVFCLRESWLLGVYCVERSQRSGLLWCSRRCGLSSPAGRRTGKRTRVPQKPWKWRTPIASSRAARTRYISWNTIARWWRFMQHSIHSTNKRNTGFLDEILRWNEILVLLLQYKYLQNWEEKTDSCVAHPVTERSDRHRWAARSLFEQLSAEELWNTTWMVKTDRFP